MKQLFQKLGRFERLFLLSLLLYAITWAASAPASTFIAFLAFIFGTIVAFKLTIQGMRKLIWRVRNRLLLSYVFIAVVPLTLVLILVGLGLYMLTGQVGVYLVYSEYMRRAPVELQPGQIPSQDFLSSLVPGLGPVFLLGDTIDENGPGKNGGLKIRSGKKKSGLDLEVDGRSVKGDQLGGFRSAALPEKANQVDIEVLWVTPLAVDSTGVNPLSRMVLAIRTRPSAVFRHVFGQRVEYGQDVWYAFLFVAGLFCAVLLASVIIGASITRRVTYATQEIYEGTQRVRGGDLSHRIAVKGNDQLAELSSQFNRMTEDLQRLILVEKERERLQSELEIAREVQSRLFPKGAPKLKTLELSGVCNPAQMVSGDYYDFVFAGSNHIAIAIGDVAGKGISAALLMASIQSVMRSQLADGAKAGPAQLVELLNRQLYENTSPEKYATFFLSLYDDSNGLFTYTNAGHLQPILLSRGRVQKLEVTGTVVGAFPAIKYEQCEVQLSPGDLLLAYTDGIVEPENSYGEQFGEQRLIELLMRNQNCESPELIRRTMQAVREWSVSTEQEDDMTLIVARRI